MKGKNKGRPKGFNCSEETKRKMSESRKGRKVPPRSEEHKRKLSEAKRKRDKERKCKKALEKENAKIWTKGGKDGFGKNSEALKSWTDAQFDGAIATQVLIKTNSAIDTSKPHIIMQSNPKTGGHDKAVKQHLKTQLKFAKSASDKAHYQHEIDRSEEHTSELQSH